MTISHSSVFGQKFDLIYAKEFYPFTRTNSYEFQKLYIDLFINNVNAGGGVVLILLQAEFYLLNNLTVLRKDFPALSVEVSPSFRIYQYVPFFKLAQLLTRIFNFTLRRKNSYFLIFKKSSK